MRKGKIEVENLSGGELTSAPLLATPPKYSRRLSNFYINSEGHIKKVPGWSAVSQQLVGIRITNGIDFKKSDGTSIILASGTRASVLNTISSVFTASVVLPETVFSGSGVNDLAYSGTYTGSKPATFEIECIQTGTGFTPPDQWSGDFFKWRKNTGGWNYLEGDINQPQTSVFSDGVNIVLQTGYGHTIGDKWTISIVDSLDDLVASGTFSGSGSSVFDVEIDSQGTPDTFKWRKDGGSYTTGVSITGAAQTLSDGVEITFTATTGHATGSKWVITATTYSGAIYRLQNGVLAPIKDNFESTNPIYMAQMGDVIVAGNGVDRPIAYDGVTFKNLNLPFGNSTVFTGTGINDFTSQITFTYETATYEVEIDAVAIANPTVTYGGGVGFNDMKISSVNYSGDLATANFDVQIDYQGSQDTFKYNINGGLFVTGVEMSYGGSTPNVEGGIRWEAIDSYGHNINDTYELKIISGTPGPTGSLTFQWRKNGGAWSSDIVRTSHPLDYAIDDTYYIKFDDDFTFVAGDIYLFQVDGATNPDTFKWRKDSEAYTEGVPITVGPIELKEGVFITFDHLTGHQTSETYTFDVARDTVKYSKDGSSVSTGEIITGSLQTIQAGVQFKFAAINGHTLGDKWTMPVDQSVRFGKMYPYKNRMWTIGADKLTSYYSDLILPTDFTGTGAGYLDFRYVIPEGDEMLDISSVLNYLAFFFKNHIVIYSGSDPTAEGDFAIYQNLAGIGVVATGCVVQVGSDVFFLTPRGIKSLKQLINAGAMNVDNTSAAVDADVVSAIEANTSGVYASAHYQKLGLVMFLIGTTMFVYNYRQNAWSRIVIPSTNDVSKILSMFTASDGSLYMGGYDYLFQFDPSNATYNMNGQAPTYRWTGPMWKMTTAESLFFNELLLRLASTKAATLTLKVRAIGYDTQVEDQSAFNQQTVDVPAITTNDAVFNFVNIPLFGAGKYVQIDITETPTYISNDDLEFASVEIQGEIGIP